jgi:hypothetical protein
MPDYDEPVQLPQQRERRPVALAPRRVRTDAGEREAGPRREPHLLEGLRDKTRGLVLLEAQFGVTADLVTDTNDLSWDGARVPDRLPSAGRLEGDAGNVAGFLGGEDSTALAISSGCPRRRRGVM